MFGVGGVLKKLERSILFSGELPKLELVSHAKWASLSEEQRRERVQRGVTAIRMAKNTPELVDWVRKLGHAKHEPAVPVLARLWKECAVMPVRVATGHALRAIGTAAARAALQETMFDADHFSVFMGVRALFDEDPPTAFERTRAHFLPSALEAPGGGTVAHQILATFSPSAFGRQGPSWTEPRAPQWLKDDPRWLRLCVELRKHPVLGTTARDVLRHADEAQVAAALEEAKSKEEPRVVHVTSRAHGDLVSRYEKGEHDAVWRVLRGHEAISGPLRDEALEVARLTMKRVLHDTELLISRLKEKGWSPLRGPFRSEPAAADAEVVREIEKRTGGPIPTSLKAFWEVVGGVDLVWDYESDEEPPDVGLEVDLDELDPLAVDPARVVTYLFDEWDESHEGVDPELAEPFQLDLAADYLHKANISGGAPYGIELPFPGADPVLQNEAHELPFVDYLRLAFRWGGFTRLERHAASPGVAGFVQEMTAGFEPF